MRIENDIPWKRLTAEGAAIVISILLAFWIDAWWEDRQRQKDEMATMRSLLSDLEYYQDSLRYSDNVYDAARQSAITLLNAGLSDPSVLSDDQIDQYLYDLSWTINITWYEVPTLEAVINNELFTEITDPEIQRRLAHLVRGINGVQNDVLRDERFYDNFWTPYLAENGSIPQIYNASNRIPGNPGDEYETHLYAVEILEKRSHKSLLSDSHFQGLLQERANLLADVFTRVDGFEENLTDLIKLLEHELAD